VADTALPSVEILSIEKSSDGNEKFAEIPLRVSCSGSRNTCTTIGARVGNAREGEARVIFAAYAYTHEIPRINELIQIFFIK
jgi:hypothetical protein